MGPSAVAAAASASPAAAASTPASSRTTSSIPSTPRKLPRPYWPRHRCPGKTVRLAVASASGDAGADAGASKNIAVTSDGEQSQDDDGEDGASQSALLASEVEAEAEAEVGAGGSSDAENKKGKGKEKKKGLTAGLVSALGTRAMKSRLASYTAVETNIACNMLGLVRVGWRSTHKRGFKMRISCSGLLSTRILWMADIRTRVYDRMRISKCVRADLPDIARRVGGWHLTHKRGFKMLWMMRQHIRQALRHGENRRRAHHGRAWQILLTGCDACLTQETCSCRFR